uniref:C1q domain-containing protein n=1 Tax=Poecilia mexicana TaxID=48701 RepID=A0A3B3YIC7_9TELE
MVVCPVCLCVALRWTGDLSRVTLPLSRDRGTSTSGCTENGWMDQNTTDYQRMPISFFKSFCFMSHICLSVCLSAKHLAFSASLLASGQGHTGPFNTHITLIFKRVVTNIGNAYNRETGLFTAPVRGVYHFEFYIYGGGSSTNPTSAELVKNGEKIFMSWTSQPTGGQKASNGVSLLLEIGDVVFMRMWANSRIYDNNDRHTTFSGHLLFTM